MYQASCEPPVKGHAAIINCSDIDWKSNKDLRMGISGSKRGCYQNVPLKEVMAGTAAHPGVPALKPLGIQDAK
jgi:hypothetical protein